MYYNQINNSLNMIMNLMFVYVFITYSVLQIQCANILGVFMLAGKSHYILNNALMRGLAEAGHNVTVVSPYEDNRYVKNGTYRNIVLTGLVEDFEAFLGKRNHFESDFINSLTYCIGLQNAIFPVMKQSLDHPNFQNLLKSDSEKFNAVIIEQFSNDALKAIAWHFQAHLIIFSPASSPQGINALVGNPVELSYNPIIHSNFKRDMNFFQRVHNIVLYVFEELVNNFIFLPKHDKLVKEYFPGSPPISDILSNVSLVLSNSHESVTPSLPTVPNMVRIGGFHINPSNKLPLDLQRYLDESKDGVVYFSMGSTLQSSKMSLEKRSALLRVFGRLKQKVLMKWENESLINKPNNVRIEKWVPQTDVLAHPNVKVFITHGGLLSVFEAIYHGVPILTIPVFYDQTYNSNNGVMDGYALSLPYQDSEFSEEKLYSYLKELLTNASFSDNAKKRSQLYHDRTMKPMDTAAYWVDYVIKHNGAPHLRVAGLKLPWYKYLLVDAIVFIVTILVVIILLCGWFVNFLYRRSVLIQTKIKTN